RLQTCIAQRLFNRHSQAIEQRQPQMPLVQRIAVRLFGKLPYQSYDPSTIVALGAAIQAACRLRSEDIEEVILTDICQTDARRFAAPAAFVT
ncbi:Hsp70 family protein, partial [Escherichia sp. TWPC-MK]